ncbi:hypothetical protein [Aureimonas sp. AU12]|uniref:hypothetical protein n=1 Tax=Aureimonas sp. AU12 TaxID=1638161 RepID=UPI0012E3A99B|nr:hypothetical protein [Aureimonas sp. AU12]
MSADDRHPFYGLSAFSLTPAQMKRVLRVTGTLIPASPFADRQLAFDAARQQWRLSGYTARFGNDLEGADS